MQGLLKMIQKFQKTASFDVQSGKGRKVIDSTVFEEVAVAVQGESSGSMKPCSALGIFQTLDRPMSTVHKILPNILHCCPYDISHVQESFPSELSASETIALEFLARMEVG